MEERLPQGWAIDRVRRLSGDHEATVLHPERLVVLEQHGTRDYVPLQPVIIIACWASYGSDLEEAIRGL